MVNITSLSINPTTYSRLVAGVDSPQLTLGVSTNATQYTYNNLNELTDLAAVRFQAYTNHPVQPVLINSAGALQTVTRENTRRN